MARGARPRRLPLTALLGSLGALSTISAIGTALAPSLLVEHPVLLIALSPRTVYLALAAPTVAFPVFLAVGLLRLVAADPIHFALGRHSARRVEASGPRWRLLSRGINQWGRVLRRFGLPLIALRPIGPVLAAAGASGVRAGPAAVADVAGTAIGLAVLYGAGRSIGPRVGTTNVTTLVAAGAIVGAATVVGALWQQRRRRGADVTATEPAA